MRDPKEVRDEYRRELEASIERENERIELPCLMCGRMILTVRSRRFCDGCTRRKAAWRDQGLKRTHSVPPKGKVFRGDSLWDDGN